MPSNADEFLPTRWSLLSRLKDWDDQESWRQFFDTYWRLIYHTGLKAGLTHTEAEEVVQEVIISVARKMGEFKTDPSSGSFKSWLLNITRWRIIDQLRKRQKHPTAGHSARSDDTARTATIERVPDPANLLLETEWDAEWEKNLMEAALERVKGRVKPEQFQIFDLLVSKRWSPATVAKRLHLSLAQVYYARYKVAAMVKREVKKLEKQKL